MTDYKTQQTTSHQVGIIARGMLDGSINYLLGAEQLLALREALGTYANDPDFVVFVAVKMALDELRGSSICSVTVNDGDLSDDNDKNGEPSLQLDNSLTKVEPQEMRACIAWAKQISLSQCESLAKRYSS